MNLKPILFSGPMIRAILDGSKTQTRRWCMHSDTFERLVHGQGKAPECAGLLTRCGYGDVGDRLWVRETWRTRREWDSFSPRNIPLGIGSDDPANYPWFREQYVHYETNPENNGSLHGKVRQSIFMPRWASRITLEITGVRVERLQEISEADSKAEGCPGYVRFSRIDTPKCSDWYRLLWDSLNAKRGFGWDVNPWVWVLEFKRVTNPEK